jgi:RHS repeat-associated protein
MTTIDNGRGAKSFVTYASMHDTTAVEQHPELSWFDGRPKASPRTQWVVKQVRVRDNLPAQDTTTSYFYKNPRYGADDRNRYGFRGFEEVTITGQSGAKTVETYGYDVDWSGRLDKTIVKAADGQIHTIAKTKWERRPLFFGLITTVHATESEAFICANGQNESTCTAAAAPGYTRNLTTLTQYSSTTSPGNGLLWAATQTITQSNVAASNGDRRTISTFHLHADASNYMLRPKETVREALDAGTWKLFGKSRETWDATYRLKQTDEFWVNGIDADRSVTAYVYQPDGTGNLLHRIKPLQSASGKKTTYIYDARKLFVASEINELGHRVDFMHEYGTGTRIQTDGPNVRTCTTTCPQSLPIYPPKERQQIKIDGLGRVLESWDSFTEDGSVYTLQLTHTNSFADTATATIPTHVIARSRLDDSTSPAWREQKTELDGHGRPIKTIVSAQGDAPADNVTTWAYGADGTLQSVSVPDPTTNDASLVTYTYTYDSLGRAKTMRRPDSTTPTSQSGINIDYDGVTETTTTVVGAAGGHAPVVKTFRDRFSRVRRVDELRTAPSTWATTSYAYGADGNIATIVGPQGVTTSLKHDFAGHRTEVTRHGRTWKYNYDKNGNLESEIAPGGTAATQALYTTSFIYDDLDRPKSKAIALRSLSGADQALFGIGTETFTWDTGANGVGTLRSWNTKGSTSSATISTTLSYDAQGHAWSTAHTLQVAGYPTLSRSMNAHLNIFGAPRQIEYRDNIGAGTNQTTLDYNYDARGMPSSLRLHRTGEPSAVLAEQTRNVAGFVTKRRNNTTSPSFVETNFVYDKLGRVIRQDVQRSQTPTRVVRQDLAYFGNDDPRSLTHYLGATSKVFNYAYDVRGQLTSVATTTAGYFNATYAYGAGGRFSRATETQTISPRPPGTEVKPRDVSYVYGDADPERVTALTNVSGGTTYAGYTYDASGNITKRCYGGSGVPACAGESVEYVYDGKDQLRRATRKVNGVVQASEEYWYDMGGARVAVVKRNAAGAKSELIAFVGGVQAHYDSAGTNTKVYSHLSLGTPVARVQRNATGTSLEYQFHGLADNTIAAVAHNGTVNASFSYAPFGDALETTNAGGTATGVAAHKRRFNDKYQDDVSGLGYYGARYYDKTLMGWTQADPLYLRLPDMAGNPRRGNLYQFVLNNPLSYIDPDGLRDQKLGPPSETIGLPYAPVDASFGGFGRPDWATDGYWNPQSIFHWSKSDPINRSAECSQPGPCGDPHGQYVSEWLTTVTEKQVKISAAVKVPVPDVHGSSEWTLCNPLADDCEVDVEGVVDIAMTKNPIALGLKLFLDTEGGQAPDADRVPERPDPWGPRSSASITSTPPPPPPGPGQLGNLPLPGKGLGSAPKHQRDKRRTATEGQRSQLLVTQAATGCAGCGAPLTRLSMVVHHIVRWADGGRTILGNLIGLCRSCHRQIHRRWIPLNQLRRRNGLPPLPGVMERVPHRRTGVTRGRRAGLVQPSRLAHVVSTLHA